MSPPCAALRCAALRCVQGPHCRAGWPCPQRGAYARGSRARSLDPRTHACALKGNVRCAPPTPTPPTAPLPTHPTHPPPPPAEGRGVLLDPHTVEVRAPDGSVRRLSAKNVLVATGGRAVKPAIPGAVSGVQRSVMRAF